MPMGARDADLDTMSSVARVRRLGNPVPIGLLVVLAIVATLTGVGAERTSAPFADQVTQAVELRSPDAPGYIAGLVLWLDAGDPDTLFADPAGTVPAAVGQPVARWTDKSSAGNDASQALAGSRPTLTTVGAHAVPSFDGNDLLSLDPTLLPTGTTASTTFVVARLDGGGGPQAALMHGNDSGGRLRWFGASARAAYVTASSSANPMTTAWPVGGSAVMSARFAGGTTGTVWLQGGDEASTAGSYDTQAMVAGVGGNATGSNQQWTGPIQEILVYDRALTSEERRTVERHLAEEWGLTLAPPTAARVTADVAAAGALRGSWTAPAYDAVSAVTDYVVEYRQQGSSVWLTLADGTSTATSATITGLSTGTTYEVRVAARNAAGLGSVSDPHAATVAALWTPADLPDGMLLWLDADHPGAVTLAGGAVSEWRDRSGNGRVVTQGNAAARPVPVAGGMLAFDGSDDLLTGTIGAVSGNVSVFGAVRFDRATQPFDDYDYVYNLGSGSGAAGQNLSFSRYAGDDRYYAWDGAAPLFGPAVPGARPLVFSQTIAAAAPRHRLWVDGTAQTVADWTGSLSLNGNLTIGRRGGGTHPLAGRVGELVVIDAAVGDTDRQRLEGYLAHQWGAAPYLPTGHPYRDAPPTVTSPTTTAGAVNSPVATPGDAAVHLSWSAPASNGGTAVKDYEIQQATDSAFTTPVVVADGTSTATTTTVTGLGNGSPAWFRIRAVNANGAGPWSTTVTATPATYRDAVLADAPVAWWRLGEPAGPNAFSEVGDRVGAATGTVTFAQTGALAGSADRSVAFGNTGSIVVPAASAPSLGSSSFTLESWVRPGANGGPILDRFMDTATGGNGHQGFTWKLNACGSGAHSRGRCPFLRIWDLNGSNDVQLSTTPMPADIWTHLAVTVDRSANQAQLYVDGAPVGSPAALTLTGSIDVNLALRIGYKHVGAVERFDGSLDEVAIYPTILSAERIAAHHRAGRTGTNDGVAPAVATGLTATPGNAQVSLAWNAVADADLAGYRVFRDGALVRQQTGTTFVDTGLTNTIAYAHTVEAYDMRGNRSAMSSAVSATPRITPGAPTGLTATNVGNRTISLSWSAPTTPGDPPLNDYRIEVRQQGGSWTTFTEGVSTATTATVTGLTAGTTHEFQVTALHSLGTGGTSSVASATPDATWTPATLSTGSVVWFDAADATTITTTAGVVSEWRDRSGNGRHLAQSSASMRPMPVAAAQGGRDVLRFGGGDALSSTAFPTTGWSGLTVFTVARWTTVGNSTATIQVLVDNNHDVVNGFVLQDRPDLANRPLAGFSDDTVQTGNGTWRIVGGTRSWGATAIERLRVDGTQRAEATNSWANTFRNQFNVGAHNGTSRFLTGDIGEVLVVNGVLGTADLQRVEGYLAHKWGLAANLPVGHPYRDAAPLAVPSSPSGLTATAGDFRIDLTWSAPTDDGGSTITDYVVEYRTSPSGTWTTFADGVSTTTSASLVGVAPGVAYDVRVAAVTAKGTGLWSAAATATPTATWTPADLPTLALWLDAADASTFTSDANGISEWRDRSGRGNHATQTTAAVRPARNTSGWVEFRGTDFMNGTMAAETLPTSLQATVAFRKTTGTNAYEAHPFTRGTADVARPLDYYNSNLLTGSASGWGSVGGVNIAAQTSWTTLSTLISGSLIRQHRNGTLATDTPGTWPYGDPLGTYHLGTRADQFTRLTGDVREIVITPQLSDADRQRLEGYLAWKWGTIADLPAGHPYKLTPPARLPGAPTVLTATGGDGRLDLSWTAPADPGASAISDYLVQYRTSPGGSWFTFADGASTAAAATITGLVNGTAYDVRVAAVNATGTGPSSSTATGTPVGPWTPANLGSLAVWLDASDVTTITAEGSGLVSQWRDRSAGARHVTAAGTVRPTSGSRTQADHNVIVFDGSDDVLASAANVDLTAGGTVYVVASNDVRRNYNGLLRVAHALDQVASHLELYWQAGSSGSGTLCLVANRGGAFAAECDDNAGPATPGWYLVGGRLDPAAPTNPDVFVQGAPADEEQAFRSGSVIPAAAGLFRIGTGYGGHAGNRLQGAIAEVVVATTPLSQTDRQKLEGYLAHKWGLAGSLPADHPYKSAPPARRKAQTSLQLQRWWGVVVTPVR